MVRRARATGPRIGNKTVGVSRRHQAKSEGVTPSARKSPTRSAPSLPQETVYTEVWTDDVGIEWKRHYTEIPDHALHPENYKLNRRTWEYEPKTAAAGCAGAGVLMILAAVVLVCVT